MDSLLISANDKLSRYNKKEYEYKTLAAEIENNKTIYQQDIEALPTKILSREGVNEYFKKIEELVLVIDESEKKYQADGIALEKESEAISDNYNKLNEFRFQKNKQLAELKQEVVDRLALELSSPSSIKNISINSTAVCTRFQSINDCLNDNENIIITNAKKTDPFLNERSVLLSYKVVDASMNMNGELSYSARMSFKPSYNRKIESMLNEKFGLKSAMLTLLSNVNADWYIDGNKVGSGKKLVHEVTLGRHGILASYNLLDQSSIEIVESNGQYTYTFPGQTSVLLPQPKEKAKPVAKEKAKEKAKDVQIPMKKPAVKPKAVVSKEKQQSEEERGYLYFMGIEPDSKSQQESFIK
ncbi:hypothetical protein ACLKMH_11980 [Psychromonas sp. KJ10-10]|uniref:hypothetical protein n=1 Tax=Psychromonas sp. KJ10-10 TaxID=3391823 RepID=UPI0039B36E85